MATVIENHHELTPAHEVLPEPESLLTVHEVAAILRVPVSWVYANLERKRGNRLPGYKIGKYWRFRCEEVFAWMEGNRA